MSAPSDAAAARLLAELHAARHLARGSRRSEAEARPSLSAAALWAHVRRVPGRPVSLAVERQIRDDPATGRRYRAMLRSQALAHTPLAIAASDGAVVQRRLGSFALEIVPPDAEAMALLLIRGVAEGASAPSLIEAALGAEIVRLELGAPIAGTIVLALDPEVAETALLARLAADPKSEIFLL
ncbi:hypothetical protein [Methylobacterium iners]|uniref:Uncharacterized protein n=1 Tax=Methylobacterium iners TaxID=418707 RepID=A0ABQ4RV18_9HYPH|nr:hypothetical protein [Methylobacterium iners]GJD94406.1 hypothetical protein OCOJLMKI_1608 [Methylobacterium iners]